MFVVRPDGNVIRGDSYQQNYLMHEVSLKEIQGLPGIRFTKIL